MGFGSDKTGFYKPSAVTVTASGNPLTLQNAKRLRKLTIYGNAVQDGTPSPDAPVEVQLCGDRTGNLLDENKINKQNQTNQDIELNFDNNETYCLFSNINGGKGLIIIYAITTGTDELKEIARNDTTQRFKNFVVDYTQYSGYILRWFAYSGENSINNIAIYKGSYTADTLPAYEPYGYKVSGRVDGVNLLDYTKATDRFGTPLTIINNGVIWDSHVSYYFFIPCDLKSGITVSFSCKSDYPENSDIINSFMVHYVDGSTEYQPIGFSITLKNDVDRIQIRKRRATIESETPIKVTNIMLVQGSYTAETMPPYEPYQPPQDFAVYLPEQIAKVGDVADEVVVDMESKTAELKKNVGSMTMSDSYSGATSTTDELVRFYHSTTPRRRISPSTNIIDVMSDIYEADTWNNLGTGSTDKQFVIAGNPNTQVVNVRVPKSVIGGETNELMNAWAANNPATVYYVLATPVTTDITSLQQWDAMPQVSGTVTLTLSAEVGPSGAEAVYTASKRPKAQTALIEENTIPEEPSDTDINTEMIMMED